MALESEGIGGARLCIRKREHRIAPQAGRTTRALHAHDGLHCRVQVLHPRRAKGKGLACILHAQALHARHLRELLHQPCLANDVHLPRDAAGAQVLCRSKGGGEHIVLRGLYARHARQHLHVGRARLGGVVGDKVAALAQRLQGSHGSAHIGDGGAAAPQHAIAVKEECVNGGEEGGKVRAGKHARGAQRCSGRHELEGESSVLLLAAAAIVGYYPTLTTGQPPRRGGRHQGARGGEGALRGGGGRGALEGPGRGVHPFHSSENFSLPGCGCAEDRGCGIARKCGRGIWP